LGDGAGELGRSFDEKHARHEWFPGKMPAEERFIGSELVLADARSPRVEFGELV
jgi:hypothetical protein